MESAQRRGVSLQIDLGNLLSGVRTTQELQLLDSLVLAHRTAAASNANLSKTVCVQACHGSGKFRQGVAAAILTLGDVHAPLQAARNVFEDADAEQLAVQVENGAIVPGFGNSFFKDHIDPAFEPVHINLKNNFPSEEQRLAKLTNAMRKGGRNLWPNAALYTAAVCKAVGFPHGVEELLFLLPRLTVWAEATFRPSLKHSLA